MSNYDFYLDDEIEDKELLEIHRKAANGTLQEILNDTKFHGTYKQLEIPEIKRHYKRLLDESQYDMVGAIRMIELMGYRIDSIYEAIKQFTGVDVQKHLEDAANYMERVPSNVPKVNCAFGKSKDKKYEWYFVMPYVMDKFILCGQKGDEVRDIIETYDTRELALEALKKKTKNMETSPEFVRQSATLEDRDPLAKKPSSVELEMKEETPDKFFESVKETDSVKISEQISDVEKYIEEKNSQLGEYKVMLQSLKYIKYVDGDEISKKYPDFNVQNVLDSNGVIAAVIEISHEDMTKAGLVLFVLAGTKFICFDTVKGEDDVIYALTLNGLDSYFNK